jgi:hypothetical protein
MGGNTTHHWKSTYVSLLQSWNVVSKWFFKIFEIAFSHNWTGNLVPTVDNVPAWGDDVG